MVVKSTRPPGAVDPAALGLAHLGFFLGLQADHLVMDRLARAGMTRVRQGHGFVIQHLIDEGRSITELARRMGVTQQAASKAVAELARLGVVEVGPAEDRRQKAVRLSARGWEAVRAARRARAAVERRLQRALGTAAYDRARLTLVDALDALGGIAGIRGRRVRQAL